MAGFFISFEGTEGCGKSTQVEKLAARLRAEGHNPLVLREPGGTPLGESIRHLLKHAPLPDLIVYDSHLQDYWRTEFHDNLPNPKRSLMTRNIESAVDTFREFVTSLRRRGYRFRKISHVYDRVTEP